MSDNLIRILIIDDEEDDYLLTARKLREISTQRFKLEWVSSYDNALRCVLKGEHDVYLIDYNLDARTGLELMQTALAAGCMKPMILLTVMGEREIDLLAMEKGAADYLVKGDITASMLERSIRYAIERYRNLRAMQESEFRYRDLFENAYDLIQSVNAAGNFSYVNRRWQEVMGYSDEDLRDLHFHDVLRPDQIALSNDILAQCRAGKTITDVRLAYLTKSGEELIIEGNVTPNIMGGRLVATRGIFHDVTSQFEMQSALRSSEARMRAILESALDCIISLNDSGQIIEFNPAAEETFGCLRQVVLGCQLTDLLLPKQADKEGRRKIIHYLADEQRAEQSERVELTAVRADGAEFPAELAIASIELNERTVFTAFLRDITARRQSEEELRQSELRYRGVVDSQTELVCRYRPDGTLTFVNEAYCRYFGQRRENLLDANFFTLTSAGRQASSPAHISNLLASNNPVTYESQILAPDGRLRWLRWTDLVSVSVETQQPEIQTVGHDITDLKRAEAELQKALAKEKELSELKSQFVTTASHEFRTPLTTIVSTASFLVMAGDELSSPLRQDRLLKIQSAAKGMTDLLNVVLTYGKADAQQFEFTPQPLQLAQFCREIVEDLQSIAKHNKIVFHNKWPEQTTNVDERLLRHILTNLLSNAIKYSHENQPIDFTLSCEDDYLSFRVRDYGIGIPPADIPYLFNPFHRASNVRQIAGTGLGLAITKNAVEVHNGHVSFQEPEGPGSLFRVLIPLELVNA